MVERINIPTKKTEDNTALNEYVKKILMEDLQKKPEEAPRGRIQDIYEGASSAYQEGEDRPWWERAGRATLRGISETGKYLQTPEGMRASSVLTPDRDYSRAYIDMAKEGEQARLKDIVAQQEARQKMLGRASDIFKATMPKASDKAASLPKGYRPVRPDEFVEGEPPEGSIPYTYEGQTLFYVPESPSIDETIPDMPEEERARIAGEHGLIAVGLNERGQIKYGQPDELKPVVNSWSRASSYAYELKGIIDKKLVEDPKKTKSPEAIQAVLDDDSLSYFEKQFLTAYIRNPDIINAYIQSGMVAK